jgi:hypothetical protein
MHILETCYQLMLGWTFLCRIRWFLGSHRSRPGHAHSTTYWQLTSNAQTLILPSPPVEAIHPRDSQPVCVVSGFPIPHVTEYTVRSWSSNTSTHSISCSVIRFQIRIVQSSDADARYRPFGAHARDHTVDEWPVSVEKQNQSSLGSSR